MKTSKSTIYDLFQTQLRYVVPLFQRGYVWTEQDQWEPLWDDVVSQAAETARHRGGHSKTLQKHFLGAVVLSMNVPSLHRVPVAEIIDGQQRLTTLQILLAVIRDGTAHLDSPFMQADLKRLTANQGPFALPEESFKVWPTSGLKEHLAAVLRAGSSDELEAKYTEKHVFKRQKWHPPRPQVVEAYLFFARKLREYLDDDDDELPYELLSLPQVSRADLLVEALIKNIQLVTIELEQEDDAQVIFETLNARGEPLTPSDLVRDFVFLTAMRDGRDVADLYERLWADYEEEESGGPPFWKEKVRQGRLTRARLDLFLFHYTWFRRKEELKISHLYQAYRDWWVDGGPRDVELELAELRRFAGTYRQLLAPSGMSRLATFGRRMQAVDTSTVNPLVLWLADTLGPDSGEFAQALGHLESFIVRRSVCGYNQKAYNKHFLDVLLDLAKAAGTVDAATLRARLAAATADSERWPSDDEFREALITLPLYRTFRPRPTQMLLEALELASRSPYAEDITVNSVLTVEHVLPQGWFEKDWPLEIAPDEDELDARARRSHLLQTVGNLTLVTQPFNSSVSNGAFGGPEGKRQALSKSHLALNAHFDTVQDWGEVEITQRSKKLADLALKVWPGP